MRYRRSLVAQCIDRLAHFHSHPLRILSIAAGHLREAEIAHAVRERRIGEYIALDQDRASVAAIDKNYSRYGALPVVRRAFQPGLTEKHHEKQTPGMHN